MGDRIRTTHAGSLPRPAELTALHARRFAGEPIDTAEFVARSRQAAIDVVRRQNEIGIDEINNGEVGRESFFTYVRHRMSGFSGQSRRPPMRDLVKYPHYLNYLQRTAVSGNSVSLLSPPQATGPIVYGDTAAIDAECAELAQALRAIGKSRDEAFVSSPSPGIVVAAMENRHYPDLPTYLDAVTGALAVEYRAILRHGFQLQIDAPDLAMERHTYFADQPLDAFVSFVEQVGDAINGALRGVAKERIRLHVCWGNYEGPHDEDVPLADIWGAIGRIEAGQILLSMANPRHAHEYHLLETQGLPPDTTLVAGVIDTTTNYIEHPDTVADRLVHIARSLDDPRRLMAGTDCGFETAAGFASVVDEIAWQKLASLVEGARRASRLLFGGN
ncbi:MAG: cobalamin-independent methionine synthase II family protein [Proteobacteria bacterium]|jgi:5-methyltetrahydropteroyltriglutamate--homocysteine methyltransferase|nr:cobalamin-independent methionine synthase II family protein [Pseudomonadota bacterium]